MSDIQAARLLVRKTREQAEAGQNGSASYALDRLRDIQQLADMASRKLDAVK